MKKRVVVALGHRALGTTLPEQLEAVKKSAKVIADLIQNGYQVAITHSNAPQVGMIHTALNEFAKQHEDYTAAPMCICIIFMLLCKLIQCGMYHSDLRCITVCNSYLISVLDEIGNYFR